MSKNKERFVYLMAIAYIYAGAQHFFNDDFYMRMMPPPFKDYALELVYISGFAELLCGFGLLLKEYRMTAAWGLVLLLIAIFPANIWMAIHPQGFKISPVLLWLRLPLQFVLIYLAWIYTRK